MALVGPVVYLRVVFRPLPAGLTIPIGRVVRALVLATSFDTTVIVERIVGGIWL